MDCPTHGIKCPTNNNDSRVINYAAVILTDVSFDHK